LTILHEPLSVLSDLIKLVIITFANTQNGEYRVRDLPDSSYIIYGWPLKLIFASFSQTELKFKIRSGQICIGCPKYSKFYSYFRGSTPKFLKIGP
jgi:hypothetical protein